MHFEYNTTINDYINFTKEHLRAENTIFKPTAPAVTIVLGIFFAAFYYDESSITIMGKELDNPVINFIISMVFYTAFFLVALWIVRSSTINKYYMHYRTNEHISWKASDNYQ